MSSQSSHGRRRFVHDHDHKASQALTQRNSSGIMSILHHEDVEINVNPHKTATSMTPTTRSSPTSNHPSGPPPPYSSSWTNPPPSQHSPISPPQSRRTSDHALPPQHALPDNKLSLPSIQEAIPEVSIERREARAGPHIPPFTSGPSYPSTTHGPMAPARTFPPANNHNRPPYPCPSPSMASARIPPGAASHPSFPASGIIRPPSSDHGFPRSNASSGPNSYPRMDPESRMPTFSARQQHPPPMTNGSSSHDMMGGSPQRPYPSGSPSMNGEARTTQALINGATDSWEASNAMYLIKRDASLIMEWASSYDSPESHASYRGGGLEDLPTLESCMAMLEKHAALGQRLGTMRSITEHNTNVRMRERRMDQERQHLLNGHHHHAGMGMPMHEELGSQLYAGSDGRKRKSRAAPPGRCHSCNRSETPEWRRGPDGARTLCNACGLHYAKLTRGKASSGPGGHGGGGGGGKPMAMSTTSSSAMAGSPLRPDSRSGSPPMT